MALASFDPRHMLQVFSKIIGRAKIGHKRSNNKNLTPPEYDGDSDQFRKCSVQYCLSMKWGKGVRIIDDWLVTGDHLEAEYGIRDG
jgi:hypothetical protein